MKRHQIEALTKSLNDCNEAFDRQFDRAARAEAKLQVTDAMIKRAAERLADLFNDGFTNPNYEFTAEAESVLLAAISLTKKVRFNHEATPPDPPHLRGRRNEHQKADPVSDCATEHSSKDGC